MDFDDFSHEYGAHAPVLEMTPMELFYQLLFIVTAINIFAFLLRCVFGKNNSVDLYWSVTKAGIFAIIASVVSMNVVDDALLSRLSYETSELILEVVHAIIIPVMAIYNVWMVKVYAGISTLRKGFVRQSWKASAIGFFLVTVSFMVDLNRHLVIT